ETANINVARERICFGKFTNAGQTSVAPDYILVHEYVKDDLITALSKTLREFYGQNIQQSPDYGRIVNLKHYHRLTSLLNLSLIHTPSPRDVEESRMPSS
ncbi:aldehyde dehydrogenase family protein, partial [Staphylococcus aureus]